MRLRSLILSTALTAVIGLGIVAVPVEAANAAVATGSISVQLTTPAGKALHKAGVRIRIENTKWYLEGRTKSSGAVNFKYFPTTKKLKVTTYSKAGTYVEVVKKNVTIKKNKKTKLSLKYAVGATLVGSVKNAEGGALVRAQVLALSSSGAIVGSAVTSTKGTYKMTGLKTGSVRIKFNARSGSLKENAAQRDYGWSYWKTAGTFSDAKSVKVRQQTAKNKATTTSSISGVVAAGGKVSGSISHYPTDEDYTYLVFDSDRSSDTAFVDVSGGVSSFSQTLNDGVYYPGIYDAWNGIVYWYTGDANALSTDGTLALPVTVDETTDLSVMLNDYASGRVAGDATTAAPRSTNGIAHTLDLPGTGFAAAPSSSPELYTVSAR